MSSSSRGFISGAAQGAATGSALGPWGALGGAVIGGIFGASSARADEAHQQNREEWMHFNSRMEYDVNMYNIRSRSAISRGNITSLLTSARGENAAISANTRYNTSLLLQSIMYDRSLLDSELEALWVASDLDLQQLEMYRARERGGIIADQAASGTVLHEGSNADVVVSQMAQEALDEAVIRHNAISGANDIKNQMATSSWNGQVAIQRNEWEGALTMSRNASRAASDAASIFLTDKITSQADTYTAVRAMQTGNSNIAIDRADFNYQSDQNFAAGLFSAAGTAVGQYARYLDVTKSEKAATATANRNTVISAGFYGPTNPTGTSLLGG